MRHSKIILVLLSSGEVYIVDQRKEFKGRYELIEVMDESDDEGQYNRSRYGSLYIDGVIWGVD